MPPGDETTQNLEAAVAELEAEAPATPESEAPPTAETPPAATGATPPDADAIRAQVRQELEAENKRALSAEMQRLRTDEGRRIADLVRKELAKDFSGIRRRAEAGLSQEERAELATTEQQEEQAVQQREALGRLWAPIQMVATELSLDPFTAPEFAEVTDLWRIGDFRGARIAARELKDARKAATQATPVPATQAPSKNGSEAVAPSPTLVRTPVQTTAARTAAGSAGSPVTAENIDALYMQHEREHPDRPNPYEAKYRIFINEGRIP